MERLKTIFSRMKGGGASPATRPLSYIFWSWLGSFVGIYLVAALAKWGQTDLLASLFLLGSFGASAVLIYGAPMVEYAQPRNLVGGHIISAVIGVTAYKFLPIDAVLLGALVVSVSIAVMHLTRTSHPPGGATALIAVFGGEQVNQAGYYFVLSPVAVGAVILLMVALITNNLPNDKQRHYPKNWL